MKIKVKELPYEEVMKLPRAKHRSPRKPNILFRSVMRAVSELDLRSVNFTYTRNNMEKAGDGPYLILMNHSSFVDLEIVSKIFYPKPYTIVCTSDGFVAKSWLMREMGCFPTQKFVSDTRLIRDIRFSLNKLNTSVLMYPEASYSFDGTATPLPEKMGVLLKRLGVDVLMVKTEGAFSRDPLYNCLQKRKVDVKAELTCLFNREEIESMSVEELGEGLFRAFTFDNFRWQQDNNIRIDEAFRADGLNRILYKCADCGREGEMEAEGTRIRCRACGAEYELNEYGKLVTCNGKGRFDHIPDWYRWEREEVRKDLLSGTYSLDTDVDIAVMVDEKAVYLVGSGHLHHDKDGFVLNGADGALHYEQSPAYSYSLYADYYWYELGDIICIGGEDALYYCFPKQKDVVAKTRLAVEELYKITKDERKRARRARKELSKAPLCD